MNPPRPGLVDPAAPPWALAAAAALGATTFTLLVVFVRLVDVAYQSPAMHVALETLAAVIAYLFLGRYRPSDCLANLLLALSPLVLASGSLFSSRCCRPRSRGCGSHTSRPGLPS